MSLDMLVGGWHVFGRQIAPNTPSESAIHLETLNLLVQGNLIQLAIKFYIVAEQHRPLQHDWYYWLCKINQRRLG